MNANFSLNSSSIDETKNETTLKIEVSFENNLKVSSGKRLDLLTVLMNASKLKQYLEISNLNITDQVMRV